MSQVSMPDSEDSKRQYRKPIVCLAPNGSFKTQADHPAVPLSHEEIALCAENAFNAGASMLHFHIRDHEHKQLLDAEVYAKALAVIKARVGNKLVLQVTTESAGIYKSQQQMQCMRDLVPEAFSVSIRELFSDKTLHKEAYEFIAWSFTNNIALQFIIYNIDDLLFYQDLLAQGHIAAHNQSILFVLGRYTDSNQSSPEQLIPLIHLLNNNTQTQATPWMCCAFGPHEYACLTTAILLGGDVRVGFENTLINKDGEIAKDNIELITQMTDFIQAQSMFN